MLEFFLKPGFITLIEILLRRSTFVLRIPIMLFSFFTLLIIKDAPSDADERTATQQKFHKDSSVWNKKILKIVLEDLKEEE